MNHHRISGLQWHALGEHRQYKCSQSLFHRSWPMAPHEKTARTLVGQSYCWQQWDDFSLIQQPDTISMMPRNLPGWLPFIDAPGHTVIYLCCKEPGAIQFNHHHGHGTVSVSASDPWHSGHVPGPGSPCDERRLDFGGMSSVTIQFINPQRTKPRKYRAGHRYS